MEQDVNSEREQFLRAVRDGVRREVDVALSGTRTDVFPVLVKGRLLRAKLVYSLCVGAVTSETVDLCVALELLHASTLVHDDIVDGSAKRRGQATVNAEAGDSVALFVGNILQSASMKRLGSLHDTSGYTASFVDACMAVNRAQLLEEQFKRHIDRTLPDYFRIIDGKTVALFRLAAQIGAGSQHLNEIEPTVSEAAICFQLIDDLEDVVEWLTRPETDVPDALLDLDRGIYTAATLIAAQHVSNADIRSIDPTLIQPHEWEVGIAGARRLLDQHRKRLQRGLQALSGKPGLADFETFMLSWVEALSDESTDVLTGL